MMQAIDAARREQMLDELHRGEKDFEFSEDDLLLCHTLQALVNAFLAFSDGEILHLVGTYQYEYLDQKTRDGRNYRALKPVKISLRVSELWKNINSALLDLLQHHYRA